MSENFTLETGASLETAVGTGTNDVLTPDEETNRGASLASGNNA